MSAIKFLDRFHSPRAGTRARFALALNDFAERSAAAPAEPVAPSKYADRAAAVLFQVSRFLYALREYAAALRERWLSRPGMPSSTKITYASVAIVAAIFVKDVLGPSLASSPDTPEPVKRPDWIEIARAYPSFALESTILAGREHRYDAWRHRTGGGRRDVMTFGDAGSAGPYIRVSFYRPGAEGMAEPDPLEATAALAAESGIDADLQETSGKVRTKFGDLPAVNMRVWKKDGWRNCLAIAGAWSDPRLGLVAWWCNPGPEMVALGEFACVIDRTALLSAGGDDQLAEFFARAELRRTFCNSQSSFVSPTPRLVNDWISTKQQPSLRGRLTAR